MEARFGQAAMLTNMVAALKDLVAECNIDCDTSGMSLQVVDHGSKLCI
jgi:proliferating cell nuclear antigen